MKTLSFLLIILISAQIYAAPRPQVNAKLFNYMTRAYQAKGWSKSGGGNDWKESDIAGFHSFLEGLVKSKHGNQILLKWGIPVDCFDTMVALQFIYAFQNDLALKLGPISSTEYPNEPITFLNEALDAIGTVNPEFISYEIDLAAQKSSTGIIVHRYAANTTSTGHAYILANAGNVIKKLEGPYPSQFLALGTDPFLENAMPVGGTLRRLYFYKRSVKYLVIKSVDRFIPKILPSGKTTDSFFALNPEMWKIFYKDISNERLFKLKNEILCNQIEKRIQKVNLGARNCYQTNSSNTSLCGDDANANYSTPLFDQKVSDLISDFLSFSSQGVIKCETLDFHKGLSYQYKSNSRRLYLRDHNNTLNTAFIDGIQRPMAYAPTTSPSQRWGCSDDEMNCLGPKVDQQLETSAADHISITEHTQGALFFLNRTRLPLEARFIKITSLKSDYFNIVDISNLPGDKFILEANELRDLHVTFLDQGYNEITSTAIFAGF